MKKLSIILTLAIVTLLLVSFNSSVDANHSWGKYHWNKSTENILDIGDNLSATWNNSLTIASDDWNQSVLHNAVVPTLSNADCDPVSGRVEVCNDAYGENGWLGIAQIWVTRGRSGHIVQGLVKMNDTYFDTANYNSPAWRDYVVCQEAGHTFGLGHQDESFTNANLGTCMDYTSDPGGTILGQLDNRHPNTHDYDQLIDIYAHLNSTDEDTDSNKGNNGKKPKKAGIVQDLNNPSEWGTAVKQDAQGRDSLFERTLPNGQILITHVLWTI